MVNELMNIPDDLGPKGNGEINLEEAKKTIKRMLKEETISLRTLEEEAGYSRSAWSSYFKGTYRGTSTNLDMALIRFLEEWKATVSLAPISALNMIIKVCNLTFRHNELAVVFGDAGVGKTVSVKHYARTHDDVILIQSTRAIQAGELLILILKRLGEYHTGYSSLQTRIDHIQLALRRQKKLIIIDEADQLPVRTLEMIRSFYDDGNCGLVLIGLPRIIDLMTRGQSLRENLAQLYSRVGYKYEIKPPKLNEIRLIVDRYGYNLSHRIFNEIREWSSGSGELRMVTKLMERAKNLLVWNELKEVTDDTIRSAYDLLIGGA